ncbi:hypothetical protein ONZ45_g5404 [Pleurotus djamor]|nr:hypothetical protein ONZ45_g5404 [Pleurotus djamor]
MRLRSDNLYLVGWRRPGDNFWYELGHEDGAPSILNEPGTHLLTLRESYVDLTRAAGWRLEEIPLSARRIGEAVRTLSTTAIDGATDLQPIARSVLTMAFTIAEASRLRSISDLVHRSWWNESAPGIHYANQVRSWARLSNAVQRTRNEGHTWDFDGQSTNIWSFVDAILALGIMHMVSTSQLSRVPRSAEMVTNDQIKASTFTPWAEGQPLLEVFHVRIKNIDGEDPGDLYGDVRVLDSVGSESLWSRAKHDHVDIKPGEDITLEGPRRPLSAADEFIIELDLWDYDKLSPDDAIAQGNIQFAPFDYYTQYDVEKTHQISGKYGSAEVSYMAMSDGLYATIKVILINGDNENPANVYGDITTNNGYGESRLFHKLRDQYIDVSPRHEIPLSRTIVAVPTQASLVVNAKLWDQDSLSPDDEIAAGSAEFYPLYKQSESQRIKGKYGEIEVQVTWM